MLAGQGHYKLSSTDVRPDKLFDRLHGLTVYPPGKVEHGRCGHPSPRAIGLTPQGFVVQLDLLGSLNDGGGASIRPEDVTGRVLVRCRKDVDARLLGMTPGFVDSEEIIGLPEPS
jgi:hypothetical protein